MSKYFVPRGCRIRLWCHKATGETHTIGSCSEVSEVSLELPLVKTNTSWVPQLSFLYDVLVHRNHISLAEDVHYWGDMYSVVMEWLTRMFLVFGSFKLLTRLTKRISRGHSTNFLVLNEEF